MDIRSHVSRTFFKDPIRYYRLACKLVLQVIEVLKYCNIVKDQITKAKVFSPIDNMLENLNNQLRNLQLTLDDRKLPADSINACQQRKIFTLFSYMPGIRKSLKERGWIEKCPTNYMQKIQMLPFEQILRLAENGNEYEKIILSKLLNSHAPQFIWQPKYPRINLKNKSFLNPIRNRIYRSKELDFTTKTGLIGCIQLSYWNISSDMCDEIMVPRYFLLNTKEEQDEFFNDYKTTYCIALLLFVTEFASETCFSEYGTIPTNILKFAIKRIKSEIDHKISYDIDENENNSNQILQPPEKNWQRFFLDCDLIQANIMKFNISNGNDYKQLLDDCKDCIDQAKLFWPTLEVDGYNNIWILKPANSCRGNGILIEKSYNEIIEFVNKNPNRKFIVQKYIERPLLIYNTKFDIRQYFLMTITDQFISIWMYKDCYLKFSSQEYDIHDFKESIHITNNSVQKKYQNSSTRNQKLPKQNMWHLKEFLLYLKDENNIDEDIWYKNIYPTMKKNIISIVSGSLDETELIPNSFEIYGCDFILDKNLIPILLEINANPDMSASTKVTAKLCPQVLDDLIKVVIDYQNLSESNTGEFEIIFRIKVPKVPLPINLSKILDSSEKIALTLGSSYPYEFVKEKLM
ncbi:tubulin glycylase 3B [Condylostylus longicornis]|uniref:tubulin glycylase 3B n=1 Tax=Condylostylus longicornis TaxID=2530218 RepID=UPI00244DAFFB|nr:tubulin glycylase 3B [Condylostylus longicornis]